MREYIKRAAMPTGRAEQAADIVLAHLTHNTYHPYATWQMNVADGDTYWGHYFETLASAEADFAERCKKRHAVEYSGKRPKL